METFKITVDTRGDSISPADWCRELQEILNRYYYIVEVEHIGKDEQER